LPPERLTEYYFWIGAGGLLGGFLATTFLDMPNPISGINLTTILTSFLGAVALLLLIRVANRRRI